MKKRYKWLGFLLLVLSAGIVLVFYNPGVLRGSLERYIGGLTGYSISIEGPLKVSTGRLLTLSAENIRVSNPHGDGDPELLSIDKIKLVLVTTSLFAETVALETLQINGLHLELETDRQGDDNWKAMPGQKPAGRGEHETGSVVLFKNIILNNATVRYQNHKIGRNHLLKITSLNVYQQADGMLQLDLEGAFNERPAQFSGSLGPYENLLKGLDIAFTGAGSFGSLGISGNGLIDDLQQLQQPYFDLEMLGPDVDEITSMLGMDDLGSGGFSIHAKGAAHDGYFETEINANVGDISLRASAQTSDLLNLHEVKLTLEMYGSNLGALARSLGVEYWPDKPFRLTGKINRAGKTLDISALRLTIGGSELTLDALLSNFPGLDASRANLSIRGDDVEQFRELLGISGIATGPFELQATLDVSAESLQLIEVELTTSLGHATVSGTLGPAPDYLGSQLQLKLDGINAHQFISAFDIDALPNSSFSLDARVELVEDGLLLGQGTVLAIKNERLEINGLLALKPKGEGTDLEVRVRGENLAEVLGYLAGDVELPGRPYDLSGRVRLLSSGIQLENISAAYSDIKLAAKGRIIPANRLVGSSLVFQINGDDLSSLGDFAAIGDSVDVFVAGQPYQVTGTVKVKENGWQLDKIIARIGQTDFSLDGLIVSQPGFAGSNITFSASGPDLHGLIAKQSESALPLGAFESSGRVSLSSDQLSIKGFRFETIKAHGIVDLELDWPLAGFDNFNFNVNIRGADIRHLLPKAGAFETEMAPYKLQTIGRRNGDLIFFQQFDANVGNLQVSLKGKVEDGSGNENLDITFSVISSDLSELGRLNGKLLPSISLDLAAEISGNAGQFVVRNITGMLGKSHFEGRLDVSMIEPRPKVSLSLNSNYLDLRPFEVALDNTDVPADTNNDKTRLIPATPIPLEAFASIDTMIRINIAEIELKEESLKNFVLEAETSNGTFSVPKLMLEGPRGSITAAFHVTPLSGDNADVTIDLIAQDMVFNLTGQPIDRLDEIPSFDIALHVKGQGGNLQELAGSLNGSLYLGSDGGVLADVNLSVLDTFVFDRIFSILLPKSTQSEDLKVLCAAAILEIASGKAETKPSLALTTNLVSLISKGTLDLNTEEIHFNFNAIPNKALKISASELVNPYILVSGTLSNPKVAADPSKVLVHGGAAVATAGLSILAKGLLDRVGSATSVCEDMRQQVRLKVNP